MNQLDVPERLALTSQTVENLEGNDTVMGFILSCVFRAGSLHTEQGLEPAGCYSLLWFHFGLLSGERMENKNVIHFPLRSS